MLLRARTVYPVSHPPIEDGAVIVSDGKIQAVGGYQELSNNDNDEEDLGEVVLMPGLINAHCHLDYTGMAGMIPPRNNFMEWIEAIVSIKANWDYSDYAKSWVTGANQLLASGCTTVADMEAVPELIPEVWQSTPLRVFTFMELLSVIRKSAPEELVNEAVQRLQAHPNPRGGLGL
ncbi:MAG: amidohydrolase family protein, partial [Limisphaerales bacterium]